MKILVANCNFFWQNTIKIVEPITVTNATFKNSAFYKTIKETDDLFETLILLSLYL